MGYRDDEKTAEMLAKVATSVGAIAIVAVGGALSKMVKPKNDKCISEDEKNSKKSRKKSFLGKKNSSPNFYD